MNVEQLIRQYEQIGVVLKDTGNPTLKSLAMTWDVTLGQIREKMDALQLTSEEKAIKMGLQQGLRDLPELIKSADRDKYMEILNRIEQEVGVQFAMHK